MVGHGPESPRFDRRYARTSTCACVVWNDDLPFVGHMLALRHDDGVPFDCAGPAKEKDNEREDDQNEDNTRHEREHQRAFDALIVPNGQ
jgi:hypothetical protein